MKLNCVLWAKSTFQRNILGGLNTLKTKKINKFRCLWTIYTLTMYIKYHNVILYAINKWQLYFMVFHINRGEINVNELNAVCLFSSVYDICILFSINWWFVCFYVDNWTATIKKVANIHNRFDGRITFQSKAVRIILLLLWVRFFFLWFFIPKPNCLLSAISKLDFITKPCNRCYFSWASPSI